MFTGLIQKIASIENIKKKTAKSSGLELSVLADSKFLSEIEVKDSISVNGVCLTVTNKDPLKNQFSFDVGPTTLQKSTIGFLKEKDFVNLELALKASDRLGGHFVLGHVNALVEITNILSIGEHYDFWIKIPQKYYPYIISEGSVALDGISLTVSEWKHSEGLFKVSIIPHTFDNTNLQFKKVGDHLNLEVDVLAKYVENFKIFKK